MMENRIEILTGIAKEIIEVNKGLLLSGGLGLALQNLKIRNLPNDIDMCFTSSHPFEKLEGMTKIEDFNADDYHDEIWIRERYQYKGFEIDIFTPSENNKFYFNTTICKGMWTLKKDEIIKFKINHALDSSVSRRKHKDDVIYILINN